MNHAKRNLLTESVRDVIFASKVTCVNIAKTAMTALTEQSSHLTSRLERKRLELRRKKDRLEQQRVTMKHRTPHQSTKRYGDLESWDNYPDWF